MKKLKPNHTVYRVWGKLEEKGLNLSRLLPSPALTVTFHAAVATISISIYFPTDLFPALLCIHLFLSIAIFYTKVNYCIIMHQWKVIFHIVPL